MNEDAHAPNQASPPARDDAGLEPPAEAPASPTPMFCLSCHHDLGGVVVGERGGLCPECGRAFQPEQPGSYAARKRGRLELILLRRVLPGVAIGLLLFTLLWYGLLPRPVALFGRYGPAPEGIRFPERSSLWMWTGSLYGPETVRLNRHIAEVWLWNDHVREVRVFDSGDPAWEVFFEPDADQPGGGIWTMRLLRPVPLTFDLLSSFRLTRERILGLVVGEHDASVTVEPFEVIGSEADVLSAYIRATGVSVRPIRSEQDQVAFWVFDEDLDRLVQVDQAELDRRGIVPVDRTGIGIPGFMGSP